MKKLRIDTIEHITGGNGIVNPPQGNPCTDGHALGAQVITLVSCFCVPGGGCMCIEQQVLLFTCVLA